MITLYFVLFFLTKCTFLFAKNPIKQILFFKCFITKVYFVKKKKNCFTGFFWGLNEIMLTSFKLHQLKAIIKYYKYFCWFIFLFCCYSVFFITTSWINKNCYVTTTYTINLVESCNASYNLKLSELQIVSTGNKVTGY